MEEKDIEKKIDELRERAGSWYANLPFFVRVLGDVVCLGLIIYVLGLILYYFGLFRITAPARWGVWNWAYIGIVSLVISVTYELFTMNKGS